MHLITINNKQCMFYVAVSLCRKIIAAELEMKGLHNMLRLGDSDALVPLAATSVFTAAEFLRSLVQLLR